MIMDAQRLSFILFYFFWKGILKYLLINHLNKVFMKKEKIN